MTNTCRRCGRPVPQDTHICPYCGADLDKPPKIIRCRYCHQRASSDLTLCPHCGRRLEAWRPDRPLAVVVILILLLLWLSLGNGWQALNRIGSSLIALLPPPATLPPPPTSTPIPQPTSTPLPVAARPTIRIPTLPPTVAATPTASPSPTATTIVLTSPTPSAITYIVRPGDTAIAIALQFDIDLADLLAYNNITDPDSLQVDQELRIPQATAVPTDTPSPTLTARTATTTTIKPVAAGSKTATVTPTATNQPGTYRVKPGDTLIAIATEFDVSVKALMAYNNIADPAALRVNQKLRIPPPGYVPPTPTPRPPTPTPTPAATPTPAISLSAPQLVYPTDNAAYHGAGTPIELRWRNPEGLPSGIENIVYIGIITGQGVDDIQWRVEEAVGTAAQYTVPAWLFGQAPAEYGRGYVWYIQTASVTRNNDGVATSSPVSPPSQQRRFFWN